MKMMPTIYKYMRPFFKERGFLYKRGSFYRIENDIAFGVYFGRPSDTVYVHFYILPLYMKTDFHHITYGDRINNRYFEQLPWLNGNSDEKDIAAWCSTLQVLLRDDVFAFFEQISSPGKLLDYIDRNPQYIRHYLFCGSYRVRKICMYTCLYLHKYDQFLEEMARCRYELPNAGFIAQICEKENKEIEQLECVAKHGDNHVDEFFQRVIRESTSACF